MQHVCNRYCTIHPDTAGSDKNWANHRGGALSVPSNEKQSIDGEDCHYDSASNLQINPTIWHLYKYHLAVGTNIRQTPGLLTDALEILLILK